MNIVVSGGGTAGHINPALALADTLRSRGHSVWFAGTPTGVESKLVPEAGVPFKAFEASGFNRNHPLTLFRALRLASKSTSAAAKWFEDIKPDVVVCFGGYVCIPVGRAAEHQGIPVVVHEQNSVMGLANKYLSRLATKVALTYEVAGASVTNKQKVIVTGNPVRPSVYRATREEGRAYAGVPANARMLVVFGGSLGARHINTAICQLKDRLLSYDDLYIEHITGPKEYDTVVKDLHLNSDEAQRWHVKGYEHQMGKVLAACDMVISRAGATSLAEISALHIPALLVPFPYATADHQTMNAQAYVDRGAAYMISDDQVESEECASKLTSIIDDSAIRSRMREASASFRTEDAAAELADVVIAAATGGRNEYNNADVKK
ncbi:MAG: undecaprenyldiphospho-muramoylpentapeptide beta-N-acetylglucosaminyltransferase [Eggerthellaceae bacterium]|jgi:UDP-N-acetylglucosamine--N-acetylmuramyl-(pentapeptide) pyrophosphoryl-undecaprenol N-acetylglucosamine transferase|nr:undecaprenyldiphospho-muramoylpentapeptide beta-N-acetylglucosaminyltransferase [Eggerthellaceae bacterium]MCH4220880.1 undecaprenyldiphospho-muramoylpentapeptide beta-N-acetylglucosaminyltransferase [Eggerthellaceae bacterium]